ncbi:MAG: acyl carrier protein [Lachnospira eligens]
MSFEKVKEILMDTINCSEDKITLEANLKDDLGIDSLDSMELMMAVEDAYGITVPEEELLILHQLKQLLSMLTRMQLNIKILRKTVCYGY